MTRKPLRALIIEDVEADAELLLRELRRNGYDVTSLRVDDPESMTAALRDQAWDVVISDYSLPRFSAPAALALLKARGLDLPFIIVSGTVDEESAVDSIRAGAHDFMAKGKFARLATVIERELRDAVLRADQKRMHEHLMVSDRMASVGTLAAGVAHEINNPLAALMANLEFMAEDLARLRADTSDECVGKRLVELEDPLRDAQECAERVRHIVKDVKVFSRAGADDDARGPVDVHAVLESSMRMAWNELRHRALLVKDFGTVPKVDGNEARLGQVFLNLIVNAAQAMPEGDARNNEIKVSTSVDEQGRVVVEVRDTGIGIPADVLPRIFDPFFTMKPGVGTGLGLAICHRIVTNLGGHITVTSEPGVGSCFRLVLPAHHGETVPARAPAPVLPAPRRARILLIDDEVALGAAVRRMLGEHDVSVVASGRAAIDRVVAGERFDLVLCDLMMPDVSGIQVQEELIARAPDQAKQLVFMTGGAFTVGAREFLEKTTTPILEKPFQPTALREFVHRFMR
jgi:signal transduction histidine kinase